MVLCVTIVLYWEFTHRRGVKRPHFHTNMPFLYCTKKEKNALKKAKVITRLYFSHSEAIKNASCTLTVCDWLTRYQSTGFMAVWQGCHTPNLKPLQPAATMEYIVRNPFCRRWCDHMLLSKSHHSLLAAFTKYILYMQYVCIQLGHTTSLRHNIVPWTLTFYFIQSQHVCILHTHKENIALIWMCRHLSVLSAVQSHLLRRGLWVRTAV